MPNFSDREELETYLNSKWGWLTDNIRDANSKFTTQMVLENSYQEMIKTGKIENNWLEKYIFEDEEYLTEAPQTTYTSFGNSQVIPRVLFPIIRRVMPSLIANKLVSVQPIESRTGVIYYIDYRFANTKGSTTAGKSYTGNELTGEDEGGVLPRYYSSEKFGPFTGEFVNSSGQAVLTINVNNVGESPIDFFVERGVVTGANDTARYNDFVAKYLTLAKKGVDAYGVRTNGRGFTVFINGVRNATVEKDTIFRVDSGNLQIYCTLNDASFVGKKVVVFWSYEQESSPYINEIDFTLSSMPVETVERKMKVRWTKESEQDMQRYHRIDVESELVKIATQETSYEQDREIIDFIDSIVPPQLTRLHYWSGNYDYSTLFNGSDLKNNATLPAVEIKSGTTTNIRTIEEIQNVQGNFLDKHRLFAQKLFELGALMAQYNRLGSASWIYVSPQMASLIKNFPSFNGDVFVGNSLKIQEFGSLDNDSITIYCDLNRPASEKDTVLMGHKSDVSEYGAGVVFSPYMQWMSDTITNPENFDSVRGFFSRYAITKVVRGHWHYAKMQLVGSNFY